MVISIVTVVRSVESANHDMAIKATGKKSFLGLKLNNSNQIEKAYACGLYNDVKPYCIEGYLDGTKYADVKTLLQGANLWNNTCDVNTYYEETEDEYEVIECELSSGTGGASAYTIGSVFTGDDNGYCSVATNGYVYCEEQ